MLISSHYMIFYPILDMHTLIVAHIIFHDLVDYFGWPFDLSEHVDSCYMITIPIMTYIHFD